MSSDWSDFISRDELLGGLPARRASTLLFAIESRTAHIVARSRQAMATYLTERTAEERERAFLDALAQGRDGQVRPSIQDLERYAPRWADLVPDDPAIRAATARMIGDNYLLPERAAPSLRQALGLDGAEVRRAFERLHGQPLDTIYTTDLPWRERLRWVRGRLAHRLESLPPFWTAFALTLTETVGAGILALPIALASIGPLAGVVIILILGLVNVLTIAAVAEAVARNGSMRYGQAFFGRLVRDYLGRPGLWVLTPALLLFNTFGLLAYYIGLSTTLADATGVPAEVWTAVAFLAALAILRRESLDATVASALVVGTMSISLILLLALLSASHVSGDNLRHATVPFVNGEPFDSSLLELVFGVVLIAFFGHTSTGNCAAVVLRRDPNARSLIRGCVAAIGTAILIYGVWVVAVNGSVSAETLAGESGTALGPLAAEVGPSIHLVGSVFAVLAMGMASIHVSLGLFNMVREWLPGPRSDAPTVGIWRAVIAHPMGRIVAGVIPVAFVFVGAEALLLANRESFSDLIGFLGLVTASVLGGIFPMLMVVAGRRKGDCALTSVWRVVGDPIVAVVISAIFFVNLLLHGFVLWEEPYQRASALIVAGSSLAVAAVSIRQGVFHRRAVVEVRLEPEMPEPAVVNVVAAGRPVSADVRWSETNGRDLGGRFHSVDVGLPALPVTELRVWAHQIDPEGDAQGLPVLLDVEDGDSAQHYDLRQTRGEIVIPTSGEALSLRITAE